MTTTNTYRPFTPQSSLEKNASRIDDVVQTLGKLLYFSSGSIRELGIEKEIAGSKIGVLHALIEDAMRAVEAHACGDRPEVTFTQRIAAALASRAEQTEAAGS